MDTYAPFVHNAHKTTQAEYRAKTLPGTHSPATQLGNFLPPQVALADMPQAPVNPAAPSSTLACNLAAVSASRHPFAIERHTLPTKPKLRWYSAGHRIPKAMACRHKRSKRSPCSEVVCNMFHTD
jgi:hypothetical protein